MTDYPPGADQRMEPAPTASQLAWLETVGGWRHPLGQQHPAEPSFGWASFPVLDLVVPGAPATQGSMALLNRATGNLGYPPKTIAHRNLMVGELVEYWAGREQITAPTRVRCRFEIERPAGHYLPVNGKRTVRELRPDAPVWPVGSKSGDTDKYLRLVLDALTVAGVWSDDCLAVDVKGVKTWALRAPCTYIQLFAMPAPQ